MIGSEDSIILINCVENYYLRKKFGVVYIRRHKVIYYLNSLPIIKNGKELT